MIVMPPEDKAMFIPSTNAAGERVTAKDTAVCSLDARERQLDAD